MEQNEDRRIIEFLKFIEKKDRLHKTIFESRDSSRVDVEVDAGLEGEEGINWVVMYQEEIVLEGKNRKSQIGR